MEKLARGPRLRDHFTNRLENRLRPLGVFFQCKCPRVDSAASRRGNSSNLYLFQSAVARSNSGPGDSHNFELASTNNGRSPKCPAARTSSMLSFERAPLAFRLRRLRVTRKERHLCALLRRQPLQPERSPPTRLPHHSQHPKRRQGRSERHAIHRPGEGHSRRRPFHVRRLMLEHIPVVRLNQHGSGHVVRIKPVVDANMKRRRRGAH